MKKKILSPCCQCFIGKLSSYKYIPQTPVFRSSCWLCCVLSRQPDRPGHFICGYTAVAAINESPPSNLNRASSWFGRKCMQFAGLKHFLHPRGRTSGGGKEGGTANITERKRKVRTPRRAGGMRPEIQEGQMTIVRWVSSCGCVSTCSKLLSKTVLWGPNFPCLLSAQRWVAEEVWEKLV